MSDPTRDHVRPSAAPGQPNSSSTINDGRSDSEIDSPSPRTPGPAGYEMLHEIGRGGMGAVYRARDIHLNRDVAVKFLQEKYSPTSLAARRFLAEAKITGQLQHPGIPPVHQVGELPDGRPFLAMKLIKGQTLADILAEKSAGRGSLVGVFEKICEAVAYAHNHGVVHRDLKPSNVMVGKFGEVQVMDWGLAKFRNETRAESAEATVASTFHDPRTDADEDLRTRTGSFLGTPAYMSPEQAIGAIDQIDERSDVFGLGGILCAILTGQPPFVGATGESTRHLAAEKKLGDAFARLDASGAEPELVALAKRCLAGERDARPGNPATRGKSRGPSRNCGRTPNNAPGKRNWIACVRKGSVRRPSCRLPSNRSAGGCNWRCSPRWCYWRLVAGCSRGGRTGRPLRDEIGRAETQNESRNSSVNARWRSRMRMRRPLRLRCPKLNGVLPRGEQTP